MRIFWTKFCSAPIPYFCAEQINVKFHIKSRKLRIFFYVRNAQKCRICGETKNCGFAAEQKIATARLNNYPTGCPTKHDSAGQPNLSQNRPSLGISKMWSAFLMLSILPEKRRISFRFRQFWLYLINWDLNIILKISDNIDSKKNSKIHNTYKRRFTAEREFKDDFWFESRLCNCHVL